MLWLAHSGACAQPEAQLAAMTTTTPTAIIDSDSVTSLAAVTASISATIGTVPSPVVKQNAEKPSGLAGDKLETFAVPTTTTQPPSAAFTTTTTTDLPEYLRNCFYAEEELCTNWHQQQNLFSEPINSSDRDRTENRAANVEASDNVVPISTSETIDDQTAPQQINVNYENRDNNSCQCREHPTKAGSWYCCNIPNISMISSCSNISKWTNLHVRNLTASALDLSNSIYRSLQSLAMTHGNISQLTNAFPRHSIKLRCLDFSNNNILEIAHRAVKDVPHLEFFGISNNLLSRVPNRNQNKNIALDIR